MPCHAAVMACARYPIIAVQSVVQQSLRPQFRSNEPTQARTPILSTDVFHKEVILLKVINQIMH